MKKITLVSLVLVFMLSMFLGCSTLQGPLQNEDPVEKVVGSILVLTGASLLVGSLVGMVYVGAIVEPFPEGM